MSKYTGLSSKQLYKAASLPLGTPELTITWPHLGTPKVGGPYDGKYGKYSLNLVVEPGKHDAFISKMRTAHERIKEVLTEWSEENRQELLAIRESPLKQQTAGKEKQETGNYEIRLSKSAAYEDKEGTLVDAPFYVVDVNGTRIPKAILNKVSTGSKVRVAFDLQPYCVSGIGGSALKVRKIILTDLVEFTGGGYVNDDDYFGDDVITGFTVEDVSGSTEEVPEQVDVDDNHDF